MDSNMSYAYIGRFLHLGMIKQYQDRLRAALGDLARYEKPDDFHITLVYCTDEGDGDITGLTKPLLWARSKVALIIDGIDSFDTPDGYAIHLRVRWDSALHVYQEEIAFEANLHRFEVSPYSKPENYKPHITLAYSTVNIEPITFDDPFSVIMDRIELSGPQYEVLAMQDMKSEKPQTKMWDAPLTQAEVAYDPNGGTLTPRNQACSTCRFFVERESGGYECKIVDHYPAPIVPNGWCDWWTARPSFEPEPLEVVIVQPDADGMTETGEMSLKQVDNPAIWKTVVSSVTATVNKALAAVNPFKADESDTSLTGFKVNGKKWVAVYSGIFEDREGEIFAVKACDDFLRRAELRMIPMPVLALHHAVKATNPEIGAKVGETKALARIGGFMVAAGEFDDTPIGAAAQKYYAKNAKKTRLSHGFWYDPEYKIDSVYYRFNTFEITLLPEGREAFPYTAFSAKEKDMQNKITDDAKKYLKEVLGDQADTVVASLEGATKDLVDMNARYKAFMDDMTPVASQTETPAAGSKIEDSAGFKALIGGLAETQGALAMMMKAMDKRLNQMDAQHRKDLGRIAQLEKMLEADPKAASEDDSTALNDQEAGELKDAKKELQKKQGEQFDPAFPGMNVPLTPPQN